MRAFHLLWYDTGFVTLRISAESTLFGLVVIFVLLELKALNGLVPQITLPSKQQLSCRNTALEGGVFSFGGLSLKKAADSTPGCDENQF